MAVGVDYARNEITFWPGGHLSQAAAEAWILKAPKWNADSKIWSTPILRKADVAPVVPLTVEGRRTCCFFALGSRKFVRTRRRAASGVSRRVRSRGNHALLANVGIGPATLPWVLYFRGVSYDPARRLTP